MGYVISGTTKDGTYLEVRDKDTNEADDVRYFLDTKPTATPRRTRTGTPAASCPRQRRALLAWVRASLRDS